MFGWFMIKIHIPVKKKPIEIDVMEFSKYLRYTNWHIIICNSDKLTITYAYFFQKFITGNVAIFSHAVLTRNTSHTFSTLSSWHLYVCFNAKFPRLFFRHILRPDKLERTFHRGNLWNFHSIEITSFEPTIIHKYRIF